MLATTPYRISLLLRGRVVINDEKGFLTQRFVFEMTLFRLGSIDFGIDKSTMKEINLKYQFYV